MKVYLVIFDWGPYDGGIEIKDIYATKEKAEQGIIALVTLDWKEMVERAKWNIDNLQDKPFWKTDHKIWKQTSLVSLESYLSNASYYETREWELL